MRVGIDGRKAGDFGIGTYIRNLAGRLVEQSPSWEWVFFHRRGDEGLFPKGENVHLVPETSGLYSVRELFSLSAQARRWRLDLFHAPHYTLPFRLPCPAVVTVHDLIHLLFPEYLPHPLARYYARYMIGRALREAAAVITVSHSSADDIRRFFPGESAKIDVIHNGVERSFSRRPLEEVRDWLAHTFDLKGQYLLFVGNPKKHKNLNLLIDAFARLQSGYPALQLVVVGGSDDQHREIAARAKRAGVSPKVRLYGNVDHDTLSFLYAAATIFVFPSHYEGFGLPPLEAMSCGTPVAASAKSSIPEVTGPATVYFSPDSVDSLMGALCKILDRPGLRDRLSRAGEERAKRFSWGAAAARTAELYRRAAGGTP